MYFVMANRAALNNLVNEWQAASEYRKREREKTNQWTGESRDRMFENVLSFPKATDHLEYFEKNPHPDKIPDKYLAFAELFNEAATKRKAAATKMEFEIVKNFLEPKLSPLEKGLLSLPDMLEEEIGKTKDGNYKTAATHLRDCFYRYFSTRIGKEFLPGIQWIDYSFITNYSPARKAIVELGENLFNAAAVKNLVEKLQAAGAFGKERKDFYLWNTSPYNWDAMSYQSRSVSWFSQPFIKSVITALHSKPVLESLRKASMPANILPDTYTALGNFTINALPEGYVLPKGNGKYDICVNRMFYFVNDIFNFEGPESLGRWRMNEKGTNKKEDITKSWLWNGTFRGYARHGYGGKFPVLSRLHEAEGFEPKCLEYTLGK